jgi:hypothetical protein
MGINDYFPASDDLSSPAKTLGPVSSEKPVVKPVYAPAGAAAENVGTWEACEKCGG